MLTWPCNPRSSQSALGTSGYGLAEKVHCLLSHLLVTPGARRSSTSGPLCHLNMHTLNRWPYRWRAFSSIGQKLLTQLNLAASKCATFLKCRDGAQHAEHTRHGCARVTRAVSKASSASVHSGIVQLDRISAGRHA